MKLKLTGLLVIALFSLAGCSTSEDQSETMTPDVVSSALEGKYKVTFVLDTTKLQGNSAADNFGSSLALGILDMIKMNVDFQPKNVAVFEVSANNLMNTGAQDNKATGKWELKEGKLRFYDFEGADKQTTNLPTAFVFKDFDGNYTQFDLVTEDTTLSDLIVAWRFTKMKMKEE